MYSINLYWLIVGCEIAFWVLLAAALAVRYLLRREGLSRTLLLSLPAVDLLLLAFTALDLRAGTPATFAHGLATAYVGFTLAFGSVAVGWADHWFAHWFAGGLVPSGDSRHSWKAVKDDAILWLRCFLAWFITVVLLSVLIAWVDSDAVTQELSLWFRIAFVSVIVWLLLGPLWSLISMLILEVRQKFGMKGK